MTPLEMIAEWRKGCSNTIEPRSGIAHNPVECSECTLGLIDALERRLQETTVKRIVRFLQKLWR